MSRASARRSGTNCGRSSRCELGVGELQRGQRGRHVAGELQLLARDQQHLLDFGERDLVARWRQVAVERLERGLLRLRFGDARLEQRRTPPARRAARSPGPFAPCRSPASSPRRPPAARRFRCAIRAVRAGRRASRRRPRRWRAALPRPATIATVAVVRVAEAARCAASGLRGRDRWRSFDRFGHESARMRDDDSSSPPRREPWTIAAARSPRATMIVA